MSFSPSLSLVRLQDLKQWQGSYDNLLQQSRNKPENHIETASQQDSFNSVNLGEWDQKKIAPPKPFEQLLEEKLADNPPTGAAVKPKKPFLRKGQGLARFRMGPCSLVNNQLRVVGARKTGLNRPKRTSTAKQQNQAAERKGILKKPAHPEVDLSPLTVPDFVKPRGTWKNVFETTGKDSPKDSGAISRDFEPDYGIVENYEDFRKSLGLDEIAPLAAGETVQTDYLYKTPSNNHIMKTPDSQSDAEESERQNCADSHFFPLNKEILQTVNDYAKSYFGGQVSLLSNEIPGELSGLNAPKTDKPLGEFTLEERKMEKELKIFETLEAKVGNSSFCSTNTSIANLLASTSTPQKTQLWLGDEENIQNALTEDESLDISEDAMLKYIPENIKIKLQEVCRQRDVLQQFLINLQNTNSHPEPVTKLDKTISTSTSFSDENTRWSSRSPSLSDNYTEFESTCETSNKIDVGINTSFNTLPLDETIKGPQSCKECEDLRARYSETKLRVNEFKAENAAQRSELKDLQKEYDTLKKLKKKDDATNEERLDKLEEELISERKKFAKERIFFENYVKEAQNRPSKKDRAEIQKLKQELADIKELVKLKDTKSGATQARLRTQVKQQEKEIFELKSTVEKLQRENAKLTASQKYTRRPHEVKMLHEINKNLSKLTEKTLTKPLNKSGHGDIEDQEINVDRKHDNINGQSNKENEKVVKNINNQEIGRDVSERKMENRVSFQDLPMNSESIEREYQSIFGNFASPRNVNCSTSVEKTEKTLADGSMEVIYSNGNLKTITADGKIIRMKYFNGDTKETNLNSQTIKYYYAATDLWHIQHPDGTEVMEFKDGHKSTKYTNGKTEVAYPDGSLKIINEDGTEEQTFPDGRKTLKNLQGEQIIFLPNGQREIHTQEYKRREYPDGTIRTLHKDGTVETVYANGRVRLKDANGVLLMDTHQT
ncbi:centromere protein J [Dendroctonus ponderosae]|uniref:Centromere protein J C-terminal domain-containing protein n=1 Tax=Dendroctonus ponderosae TaxID=77166 RepID=A0AAR5PDB5_DENPD|nr:centromere protein J [Dendroctonus ponderosae]KAH1011447.1 hypothetical protein HUJ04_000815 [Dendroctonus ponderosae]KAH1011448.1 hypothetical protein HUJ04_000815 [Dendroctonus ponderosae]KAH1018666.1 hypothetical protein HUJ05_006394 [Dendroctonus ponderosae]KAH1018667.1 hypothetical protein HUJ05_006394 [Dendroctonus ponderosae]